MCDPSSLKGAAEIWHRVGCHGISAGIHSLFTPRYTPKIRKMKTLLLSHLDKVFVEAVVPSNLFDTDKHDLDVNLLSPILRSYVTMEEEVHRSL